MEKFINFTQITTKYLNDSLEHEIKATVQIVAQLVEQKQSNWQTIILPLHSQLYKLNKIWGLLNHLQSVKDSSELRDLHDKFLPLITELFVNIGQNKFIYQHVQAIKDNQYHLLNPVQQKVIANELRDFKLSGISLPAQQQDRFKQVQTRLSELSTLFEQNVMDATDSYAKWVARDELSGVPHDNLTFYHNLALEDRQDGYKINLHMPSYLPIMQFCNNRKLREELYYAYVTRASELGNNPKYDNSSIIHEILKLRHEKAQLLDFNNYAELSLFNKMANNSRQVLDFLYNLAKKSRDYALNDLAELKNYARQLDNIEELNAWDIPYYSEKLQQHKYAYSSDELKQYFQLPIVFAGLFDLIKQLYNLDFVPNDKITSWHPDVITYDAIINDKTIGHIYFDLYARNSKQPGAWMNSADDRHKDDLVQRLPIAYVICNFTSPNNDKPVLLNFDEVQTLFHEMGHALHHLLTEIDNFNLAGINGVEWDAVELPSQFMENFVWNYDILINLTAHAITNEKLPRPFFEKVLASRYYQSGLQMLRQLEFAIFDMRLHCEFDLLNNDYLAKLDKIRAEIAVINPPTYNRFANSFSHIFAGGYAAGYYSYKWAELLACDIFSVFDGVSGNTLNQLGEQFRANILSQGGFRPMLDNFEAFMHRSPQIEALLKYSGML